jgi:hypothetical protein
MKFALIVTLLAIVSCAHHVKDTNKLKLGMDRSEVEKMFGEPESTKMSAPYTYLTYNLKRMSTQIFNLEPHVFVFDEKDKLIQFGSIEDFSSRQKIDMTVKHQ